MWNWQGIILYMIEYKSQHRPWPFQKKTTNISQNFCNFCIISTTCIDQDVISTAQNYTKQICCQKLGMRQPIHDIVWKKKKEKNIYKYSGLSRISHTQFSKWVKVKEFHSSITSLHPRHTLKANLQEEHIYLFRCFDLHTLFCEWVNVMDFHSATLDV